MSLCLCGKRKHSTRGLPVYFPFKGGRFFEAVKQALLHKCEVQWLVQIAVDYCRYGYCQGKLVRMRRVFVVLIYHY